MNRRNFIAAGAMAGVGAVVQGTNASTSLPSDRTSEISADEEAIERELPIVDAHHHLWDFKDADNGRGRYLLSEILADIAASGHRITQTVFVECGTMYRTDGPAELRPVGQTEFANGIAAMSASGIYGPSRIAAGIIATADLRLGDNVNRVLEAQVGAGNGRLRGIRVPTAWIELPIFGHSLDPSFKDIMRDAKFREGFGCLARHDLSSDIWCFHTQLADVADIAGAFPNTLIVLNHLGTPLSIGPFANKQVEVLNEWKRGIRELSRRHNVVVKLGGLGMDLSRQLVPQKQYVASSELASRWRPLVETCIGAFGVNRCMFESNFPPDRSISTYGAIWNAFKRITMGYSGPEKNDLFSATAKRVYRLPA